MKLKLYETLGEDVTRDLEIEGTLTDVLVVLDVLMTAEKKKQKTGKLNLK